MKALLIWIEIEMILLSLKTNRFIEENIYMLMYLFMCDKTISNFPYGKIMKDLEKMKNR